MINAQKLKEIADLIKREAPGLGFSLVVFDFGTGVRDFRYISNAERADMIETFDKLLEKWKRENPLNN